MNEFDLKSRERLVRVEEGINNIKSLVEKQTEVLDKHLDDGKEVVKDIASLKTTQKWIRWVSKTAIGGAIMAFLGYIAL